MKRTLLILSLFLFVLVMWALSFWLITKYYGTPCDPSSFGDMFGCVSALFSGLAFAGLLIAILLQKEELKYQRLDLELTRYELKGQKEQLEYQNVSLKKQIFENKFFQLLKLQTDIIDSIDLSTGGRNYEHTNRGRDCFVTFYHNLSGKYQSIRNADINSKINDAYKDFYKENSFKLNYYFKNLFRIYEFIENSDIDNKVFYINITNSILSDQELLIIFYHMVSGTMIEKFRAMIIKYNIFEDLPIQRLLDSSHLKLIQGN